MVRRFTEVIHVGLEEVEAGGADSARPVAFQWRGQRYVVQEVLGHWRERRAWWAGGAEEVLVALPDLRTSSDTYLLAAPEAGVESVPPQRKWANQLGEEYEVWRVEARRSHGIVSGVYDLCHDGRSRPTLSTWRLLRLVD